MRIAPTDAVRLLARANPVPPAEVESLRLPPEPTAPWVDWPTSLSPRRPSRRHPAVLTVAAIVAAAIATPAVAMRSELADLFGFSNRGSAVVPKQLSAADIATLRRVGLLGGLRFLGTRSGIAFYTGRSASGGRCFTAQPAMRFGCVAPKAFPSPAQPIVDLSPTRASPTGRFFYVWRLEGFASDGVRSVDVVTATGRRFSVDVEHNIYASGLLPEVRAAAIEARDAAGRVVYRKLVAG